MTLYYQQTLYSYNVQEILLNVFLVTVTTSS